ncbi:MAG: L-rhamnose mutarotase [Bacteroidetes bacterium]|nr:L-rhamnose mutarotase [Bacteroidota bacterium]MDA0888902.1 L-rhamnose mutarotase [Bacteroidota bacterium]MDA1176859.1 L-rhamnose mutarotase [Bacteroidota bacterium]
MHKYCLALDLKDDPEKIDTYIKYHKQVWPEINQSIKASGIQNAEIYHTSNRLFMILEVDDTFSFEKKASMDADNPKVQEWETLMWKFQQALPNTPEGTKWVLMEKIYDLNRRK